MSRIPRMPPLLAAIACGLAFATTAVAQPTVIRAGETVHGRLEPGDAMLDDGSYYDLYLYAGQPGERIIITMRSGDFDAFLAGGTQAGEYNDMDDDGAGGTDARLQVTLGPMGMYAIRANSLHAGETGDYTLTIERAGDRAPTAADVRSISAGETVSGRLDPTDPVLDDGSYYDLYLYAGKPGDEIIITLRSADFDAYLSGGTVYDDSFSFDDHDDDGAGGTDARLTVTVGSSGFYGIRANSFGAGRTGDYTLTVEKVAGPATPTRTGQPAGLRGQAYSLEW